MVNADFDSILGFLDSSGSNISDDDDSGDGLLSRLFENVPGDGRVILAVSGFSDFGFSGDHEETGPYELEFELGAIPEPAQYAFLLSAFLGLTALALGRRRMSPGKVPLFCFGSDFTFSMVTPIPNASSLHPSIFLCGLCSLRLIILKHESGATPSLKSTLGKLNRGGRRERRVTVAL